MAQREWLAGWWAIGCGHPLAIRRVDPGHGHPAPEMERFQAYLLARPYLASRWQSGYGRVVREGMRVHEAPKIGGRGRSGATGALSVAAPDSISPGLPRGGQQSRDLVGREAAAREAREDVGEVRTRVHAHEGTGPQH